MSFVTTGPFFSGWLSISQSLVRCGTLRSLGAGEQNVPQFLKKSHIATDGLLDSQFADCIVRAVGRRGASANKPGRTGVVFIDEVNHASFENNHGSANSNFIFTLFQAMKDRLFVW